MSTFLYLYRSCSSCREAETFLREHDVVFITREYFKDRFAESELWEVLRTAGMQPSALVSRRSKVFRDQGLGEIDVSEEEWVSRMLDEPTLIRRPILVRGDQVVVGFKRQTYESLFMASGTACE